MTMWYRTNERLPQPEEEVLAIFENERGKRRGFKTSFTYKPYEMENAAFVDGFYIHDNDFPDYRELDVVAWAPIHIAAWLGEVDSGPYSNIIYGLTADAPSNP